MTSERSPVRLADFGSEAPSSLRAALASAARHEPATHELVRIEAGLLPLLDSATVAPTSIAPVTGAQSDMLLKRAGWSFARGAAAIVGTAGFLIALPQLWRTAGASTSVNHTAVVAWSMPAPELAFESPALAAEADSPADLPSRPRARDAHARPRPVDAPPVANVEPAPPIEEPSLSEAQLLERARRTAASDPRAALDLVREHERRFASGALVQEREVIAIDVLDRLGKSDEARARGDKFRARYPSSLHGKSVEVAPSARP